MIENIYECPICGMMWHSSINDNCPVEDCEVVGNIVGEYKLPAETILPTLDDLLEAQDKMNIVVANEDFIKNFLSSKEGRRLLRNIFIETVRGIIR